MAADQYLEVVNDLDEVVGRELRSTIHRNGLLHREVHVWFFTREGEVVFQRRASGKDTYPNMLDATAGGHVEPGQDYLQAALMEAREETGFALHEDDLIEIGKLRIGQADTARDINNQVFRMVYGYYFTDELSDLRVEEADGAGFEKIPLGRFEERKAEIIPNLLSHHYDDVWQFLKDETDNG